MLTAIYLIVASAILGLLLFGLWYVVRAYGKQRGAQVITCPETRRPAMVEVDARRAALTSVVGQPDMRLSNCSRWPLKKECGQECLLQIESAPAECLVQGVLAKWYKGRRCVYCGKLFDEIYWTDHKPALMNAQRELVEWREVPPTLVFEVLETHQPVCWNCYIAQSFLRDYPQLVVDRSRRGETHPGR